MYINAKTLQRALQSLRGTANHLLKIWLVLKVMGLKKGSKVVIDTNNSTSALKILFSSGAPDGSFFVPFAHTIRFSTMKSDASRSIIQTTLQRWVSSQSVVTCDPTEFLQIENQEDGRLSVSEGKNYPLGLGYGSNGFALEDNSRVSLPLLAMAVWVFVRDNIENDSNIPNILCHKLRQLLNLDVSEERLIFVDKDIELEFQQTPLSESEIWSICEHVFDTTNPQISEVIHEDKTSYIRKVKNMVTISDSPIWMQQLPEDLLRENIKIGEKTLLLYGPPRTGKTHAIDTIVPRESKERITIQMHEGWSYENLIMGCFPDESGAFKWKNGCFLQAILDGFRYIVLEEINRTAITQALGEAFSLLENAYRGEEYSMKLPNGNYFFIPKEVTIFLTMNTIDASTEDVDDALLGRCASIEFLPRIESLDQILTNNKVSEIDTERIKEVFNAIQSNYPLGHGYFAEYGKETNFFTFYLAKIRPVLENHFSSTRPEIVSQIDNFIDQIFKN